jgi:type I restriction enzyme S subunit
MEQYGSMRSSGVSWIQDIPSDWGIRVLFQLVGQVKNKNKDLVENNLLSLSYGKIKRKDINNPEGLLPESFDGYNIIETDDIVLRLTDLQNDHTSLRVGQAKERGIITSAYTTLRPSSLIHPQYLYYALHAYDLIKGFYGMGAGVRQGLTYDEVKTIKVPFPPADDQSAIVDFLNDQVDQIDSIISEAKKCVDDYKRWKSSVIFEAVTKGIDPEAKTRESAVSWIGCIPEHWRKLPLKRVTISRDGGAWGEEPTGTESDRICLRVADFEFEYGRFKHLPPEEYTKRAYTQSQIDKLTLATGDILIEKSGGGEKTPVGRAVLYDIDEPALFANFMDRVRLDKKTVLSKFFEYYWQAMYYLAITTIYIKQTTGIQNLNLTSLLEKELIVIPPIAEQQILCDYLDSFCENVKALIDEKMALISDLELYKRSLIYETVTGKRKVGSR